MEWDAFQVLELLQMFESKSVNSILELRQTQWKEMTAKTTEFKEMVGQLRDDLYIDIQRLKTEREELVQKMKQKESIIKGKEIEILGLRHQLRSMLVSKPICNSCSQQIVAPEIKNVYGYEEYTNTKDSQAVVQHRKRTLVNTSITTSMDSMSTRSSSPVPPGRVDINIRHRPSQKRRCLRDLNGQLAMGVQPAAKPNILVAETQQMNAEDKNAMEPLSDAKTASPEISLSGDENLTATSPQSAPTLTYARESEGQELKQSRICPVGMTSFSPPTQAFDASLAIRAAVNHADLDDYEKSFFAPPSLRTEVTHDSVNSTNLFKKTTQLQGPMANLVKRRRSTLKAAGSKNRHRENCRHHHKPRPTNGRGPSPVEEADATGVDLTDMPSDLIVLSHNGDEEKTSTSVDLTKLHAFSATEAHVLHPSPKVKSVAKEGRSQQVDLPSIGGSPIKQTKPIFKKPQPVTATLLISSNPAGFIDQEAEPQALNNRNSSKTTPTKGQSDTMKISEDAQTFLKRVSLIATSDRDSKQRRNLPAFACKSCEQYYQALGYSVEEVAERLQNSSKHRHLHTKDGVEPLSTPEGFWNLDMSLVVQPEEAPLPRVTRSTQNISRGRNSQLRRRRPLEFPAVPES